MSGNTSIQVKNSTLERLNPFRAVKANGHSLETYDDTIKILIAHCEHCGDMKIYIERMNENRRALAEYKKRDPKGSALSKEILDRGEEIGTPDGMFRAMKEKGLQFPIKSREECHYNMPYEEYVEWMTEINDRIKNPDDPRYALEEPKWSKFKRSL